MELANPPDSSLKHHHGAAVGSAIFGRPMFGRPVMVPWLASRIVMIASLVGLDSVRSGRPVFAALTDWDCAWYSDIARYGYGHGPVPTHWADGNWSRWPFFPLLPAVTRALMSVGLSAGAAIVTVNNVAFLVALAGFHRLATRWLGPDVAAWAVWALVLFPGSITSVMGYPGGLFLAGTVWSFEFAEDGRFTSAGLAAAVATSSRPNGVLILIALLVMMASSNRRGHFVVAAAKLCMPSVAFVAAWSAWLGHSSGDPLVFIHAKSAWPEKSVVGFVAHPNWSGSIHLFVASIAVVAIVVMHRRLPASWTVLAVVSIAPSLLLGVVGLSRYCAECFPVAMALGALVAARPRWMQRAYLAASTGGLITTGVLVHHAGLVP